MPALPAARKSSVLGPEADLCDEIYANEGIRDFIADGKGFKRALGTVITIHRYHGFHVKSMKVVKW